MQYQVEIAFAYDWEHDTGRVLGTGLKRNYKDLSPTEWPGTADVFGSTGGAVFVCDYKTGFKDVTPCRINPQMWMLSLAAARAYDVDTAIAKIAKIDGDRVYWDSAEFTSFDLDDMAETFRETAVRVRGAEAMLREGRTPDVFLGEHCGYCDSRHYCPAHRSAANAIATTDSKSMTREQIAKLWPIAKAAERALEDYKQVVRTMTADEPIEIEPGRFVGVRETKPRETLDGAIAYQVLSDMYHSPNANKAAKLTVSKRSIDSMLRAMEIKNPRAERELILSKIRQRGGIIEGKPSKRLEEWSDGGE